MKSTMKPAIGIYSVLLIGALGGAYRVWTEPPETAAAPDAVTVLPGASDELERVHYRSKRLDLVVEMREDGLGRYGWVRAEPIEPEQDEDSDAATGGAPEGPEGVDEPGSDPDAEPDHGDAAGDVEAEAKVTEFKAAKSADNVLAGLMPFVAKRALDGIGDDQLDELGLAEPEATLEIQRKGREPKVFEVGGNVYGGSNVYVRDPENGNIYVVDAKVIRPLQSAEQTLVERELLGVETSEIQSLTLSDGEHQAEFEQHNPDDPAAVFWSAAGESSADAAIGVWVDKALRLRGAEYVQEGDVPAELEPAYAFTVRTRGRKAVKVELMRAPADAGTPQWFARSEYTRGLVKLRSGQADDLAVDVPKLLGVE